MKHYIIIGVFAALATSAGAHTPTFTEPVKVNLQQAIHSPILSTDGKTLLFSCTENHTGLNALNLADNSVTKITDGAGAAFNPVFSTDGRTVFFRTATSIDGLMNHDVQSYSLDSKTTKRVAAPSRRDINLSAEAALPDYAFSCWKTITVSTKGYTATISPLADAHSYQWASLSPDGERLLFTEPFKGVFISGIDGSSPVCIAAKGDYPTWASDTCVLIVVSHDDGYGILDSALYAIDINTGEKTLISPADMLVAEVTAAPLSSTVAFTTMTGELYMFNLK